MPILISVGAVKPRKGYHTSLAAFASLKTSHSTARYLIIGPYKQDAYFSKLQEMISQAHVEDVVFLGAASRGELGQYYQQASLFVLAPQQEGLHFEGFGLVYLEAGAYGLPVVGTRTGGVPDAVKDGETGLLAEPDDVFGVAEAIFRLLGEPPMGRPL